MDVLFCAACGGERAFETPDCRDGHVDCPERACVVCGAALVVGWLAVDETARAAPARRRGAAA